MQKDKLGTIYGVFIPNVTFMFGVILFLRLGLIVSHAGLATSLIILGLSLLIMLITSASISAIATNMDVGSGGVYYLVTRTLGVEIGGALGIALYLSQLLSIALTTTGFAYTLVDVFPQLNIYWVEVITLVVLASLSSFSAKLALQVQGIIFIILVVSVVTIFFGSMSGVEVPANPEPYFEGGKMSFWLAFAFLYPALTGIEAGMAMSGNLKNPARSLMLGNAASLIFSALVYGSVMAFAYFFIPKTLLLSDPFAFMAYAKPSWIVTVGICAATLSSALGGLLGAPRMLQSMGEDGVVPSIFRKTIGRYKEPVWALTFTAAVALFILLTTSIDQIIPILTMICLITYGLLNLISGLGTLMNAPSWRPQFKVHYGVSLFGVALILVAMFMVNASWSFIAIVLVAFFYFILRRRDIEVGFQDIRDSILFFLSRLALYRLSASTEHAYTWHPQVLTLITAPSNHPKLIWLAHTLTRQSGILSCGTIIPDEWASHDRIDSTQEALETYFKKKNIACLTEVQTAPSTHEGFLNYIKSHGMGPIQPNTILLPVYDGEEDDAEIAEIAEACYMSRKNLALFRDSDLIRENIFRQQMFGRKKRIDIWWDSYARESFDLLVSLITTLHDNRRWSKAEVTLKAVATVPEAVTNFEEYLTEFVSKSRLKMNVKVVLEEGLADDDFSYISRNSKKADLVAVPMNAKTEDEPNNDYKAYYKKVMNGTTGLGVCLYVASYDDVDHREIYTYPEAFSHGEASAKTDDTADEAQ